MEARDDSWMNDDMLRWARSEGKKAAYRYEGRAGSGGDAEDVAQDILLEMFRKRGGYDPTRGNKFSTYFGPHIRHRARKAAHYLNRETGVRGCGVQFEDGQQTRQPMAPITSHDSWAFGDGDSSYDLEGPNDGDPSEIASAREERAITVSRAHAAVAAIGRINPRLGEIIKARILGEETLEQVGARLGITRERVRQLQVKGLSMLQSELAGRMDEVPDEGPLLSEANGHIPAIKRQAEWHARAIHMLKGGSDISAVALACQVSDQAVYSLRQRRHARGEVFPGFTPKLKSPRIPYISPVASRDPPAKPAIIAPPKVVPKVEATTKRFPFAVDVRGVRVWVETTDDVFTLLKAMEIVGWKTS